MINLPISEEEAQILLLLLGKLPTETKAYPLWERLDKLLKEKK